MPPADTASAKFHVGQLIHHKLFEYRGVIVDVDPHFLGTETWYQQVAKSRPPKDSPWYHVLVDGQVHQTYVAERNLEADNSQAPISHPNLGDYFSGLDNNGYQPKAKGN